MFATVKNIKLNGLVISFLISLFIHSGLFILVGYLLSNQLNRLIVNTVYVEFLSREGNTFSKNEIVKNKKEEAKLPDEIKPDQRKTEAYFYNFSKSTYDSSALIQVYKESTLNVSLRYPGGWTYLDQDVKNKLDGVTFWAVNKNYKVPPYVHFDVKDKDVFNPSRYKYKFSAYEKEYYYNDPEELEGYFTQMVYIRTNSDKDYSIKLMVKGRETFKAFQPVFFNMAKSFNFDKSFF